MADVPGPDEWCMDCDKLAIIALLMLPFIFLWHAPELLRYIITGKGMEDVELGGKYDNPAQ